MSIGTLLYGSVAFLAFKAYQRQRAKFDVEELRTAVILGSLGLFTTSSYLV